jgi:tetratricopeptide (TPR) repeat protein
MLAIKAQKILDTPKDHWERPRLVTHHSDQLIHRYMLKEQLPDIEKVIEQQTEVLVGINECDTRSPRLLFTLGRAYSFRFGHTGNRSNCREGISCFLQALNGDLRGCSSNFKIDLISHLGTAYLMKHTHFGRDPDLDHAILFLKIALQLTPDDHLMRAERMNEMGTALRHRFQRLGQFGDISQAIALQRQSNLLHRVVDDEHFSRWLHNLGTSLAVRFSSLGDEDDLTEAIDCLDKAIPRTTKGQIEMVHRLVTLGTLLLQRFHRLGKLSDLDGGITHLNEAPAIAPVGNPATLKALGVLASLLHERFDRLGNLVDLDRSIERHEQYILASLRGHATKPGMFGNYARALETRYNYFKDPGDLDKAIAGFRHAVAQAPADDPRRSISLRGLGKVLCSRFKLSQKVSDIDESIKYLKEVRALGSLGRSYRSRFIHLGQRSDLESSLWFLRRSVERIPEGDPSEASRFCSLAKTHHIRFSRRGGFLDLVYSLLHYERAAKSPSAVPSLRLEAARDCARLYRGFGKLGPYHLAIGLLPHVAWLGTTIDRRYKDISSIGATVTEAASAAIQFGEYGLALEWLEAGRSIVWKQMLQMRTPVQDLALVDSGLAARLQEVAHALESAGTVKRESLDSSEYTFSEEQEGQTHRRMAEEWDSSSAWVRGL